MTGSAAARRHLFIPWTVQEREDPVLTFDHGEGVYFYDAEGRHTWTCCRSCSTAISATAIAA